MNEAEYRTMRSVEDGHWWYVSLHELILASLPDRRALRILDAGCGTGRLLELLSARGKAEGCDASEQALIYCRERGVNAVRCDLNALQPARECYDLVTIIDVLYHRAIKDDGAVLRSLYRALKPGGRLILQVPAWEWLRSEHDEAVHTARRYTRPQVERLVQASGFVPERSTYRVALLFMPVALLRMLRRVLRRKCATAVSDVRKHASAVNRLLTWIMKGENVLLRHFDFPFGTSVFIVAKKPEYQRHLS